MGETNTKSRSIWLSLPKLHPMIAKRLTMCMDTAVELRIAYRNLYEIRPLGAQLQSSLSSFADTSFSPLVLLAFVLSLEHKNILSVLMLHAALLGMNCQRS